MLKRIIRGLLVVVVCSVILELSDTSQEFIDRLLVGFVIFILFISGVKYGEAAASLVAAFLLIIYFAQRLNVL